MAKRIRGSTRPGQRRPTVRPAGRPAAPIPNTLSEPVRRLGELTEEEEARAAELEAQIVSDERAAEETLRRSRERARTVDVAPVRTRETGSLAVRFSHEYAYVARDVLRIVRVGGGLLGILAILYILIDVTHVITL